MLKRWLLSLLLCLFLCEAAAAANTTLGNLTAGGSVAGTDLFYDVQTVGTGGVKVTGTQLNTFIWLQGGATTSANTATFSSSALLVKGSSTGTTALASANASASNFTLTFPAATDQLVARATTDTLTNKTVTSSTNSLGGVTAAFGSDAKGDLYQNGGASVIARLPIGTSNQLLTVASGLAAWASNVTVPGTLTTSGSIISTVRSSASATVTASATTDYFFCLDPTSNAITVNLPATPTTGLTYLIKDCTGQAATHNITVTPNSGNIDGAASFVMSTNFQSIGATYTGSQWSVN